MAGDRPRVVGYRMSDPSGTITLDGIGRLLRELQTDVRQNRRDIEMVLPVMTSLVEQVRRMDRHMAELKDDMELMIRAELMGSVGNLRNRTERELEELGDRVSRLEIK